LRNLDLNKFEQELRLISSVKDTIPPSVLEQIEKESSI